MIRTEEGPLNDRLSVCLPLGVTTAAQHVWCVVLMFMCVLSATGDGVKLETKMEIKTDADTQPPPEKKTKVMGS